MPLTAEWIHESSPRAAWNELFQPSRAPSGFIVSGTQGEGTGDVGHDLGEASLPVFLLQDVFLTGGQGASIRRLVVCIGSRFMRDSWDANTVTHILGLRAFGMQLLCEQVVGRGLRRMSYSVNDDGKFDPEYAEVYGVPFSFIPCSGASPDIKPVPMPTRVRSLENRIDCEITFPRLLGYRYDIEEAELQYEFTADSRLALSTQDLPLKTENAPIVGQSSIHSFGRWAFLEISDPWDAQNTIRAFLDDRVPSGQ